MKIAVIGAGIVGMCTAYELVQDGHEVSIFERNASVAQEASFACAGHLFPSLSHPLALPSWPHGAWLRAVLGSSPFSLGKGGSLADLRWLMGWKAPGPQFADLAATAFELCNYSQEQLHKRSTQASLVFEQAQGNLLLWPSEAAQAQHQKRLQSLKDKGLVCQQLSPEQARAVEPALHSDVAFQGASYFPQDEVGNCRQFAHLLKDKLAQAGAKLHFSSPVLKVTSSAGVQIHTSDGSSHGVDHAIICAGTGSSALGLPGSQALPLTAVWSYSLSAPIREPLNAPRSVVQDCQNNVAITRIGARVRVTGGAEVGSRNRGNVEKTVKQLYRSLNSLFPGAADFSRSAQIWKGASQFTPDGLPLVGPSITPGIWLNLGHGQNGWTMAAGSARVVADLVASRNTEVNVARLHPGRFQP
jgi:D-amino-acid dehydrogenase